MSERDDQDYCMPKLSAAARKRIMRSRTSGVNNIATHTAVATQMKMRTTVWRPTGAV